MKRVLTIIRKGDEVLRAIDGLSQNDITVLQLIKIERMSFLDLNAMVYRQLKIGCAIDIVSKLKDLGLVTELTERRIQVSK